MAKHDRGLQILFLVGVLGLCAGTVRAFAERNRGQAQQSAARGPASVTQDAKISKIFDSNQTYQHQELAPKRSAASSGSKSKSGNWSLSNMERADELKSRGNYQPRSTADRGRGVVPSQSDQILGSATAK